MPSKMAQKQVAAKDIPQQSETLLLPGQRQPVHQAAVDALVQPVSSVRDFLAMRAGLDMRGVAVATVLL